MANVKISELAEKITWSDNDLLIVEDSDTKKMKVSTLRERLGVPVNVKDFGAIGDGTTDDLASIQNAITYATTLVNATLYFPKSIGYAVSAGVVIPNAINVIMEAPILYTGSANIVTLTVGVTALSNYTRKLRLKVVRSTQSDWTSEDSIGIKIINANNCDIEIVQSDKHTIGVQFMGSADGFAYNEVTLQRLYDNKIGVDLTNELTGWCNENNFYGGRITTLSTTQTGLSRYGLRITSKDLSYLNNNNNVFQKPSFELKVPTVGEAVPILIEHGQQNSILKIRNEGNSVTTVRVSNDSSENIITTGYGAIVSEDLSTSPTNSFKSIRYEYMEFFKSLVFNANALHKKACFYDGATNINVPTVHIANSSNASAYVFSTGLTLNADYLELATTRGVGIFIKTKNVKQFVVKRDTDAGYSGRVMIRCYNAAGVVLTSADPGHPYVKGSAIRPFTYNSGFGGVYRIGSDTPSDIYFQVGPDVEYVVVIVAGVSAVTRIRSFSVFANEYGSTFWTGYQEIAEGMNLASAAPTAGTWEVGRRVLKSVPAVGQPKGWICTVAGTPGTWVSEGNL